MKNHGRRGKELTDRKAGWGIGDRRDKLSKILPDGITHPFIQPEF